MYEASYPGEQIIIKSFMFWVKEKLLQLLVF